ncbi:MAG: right-handed parallel beta-helix repeat-containing protein [Paludibacteraceae bacterium]|nr:right-handed parallel beta-helix repeat-containing protein [Paludibacteraceae bacterium]
MKHSLFLLAVGLLCWTGAQAATINHAYDGSKSAAENGTALQDAIDAASSGDELKVQAGTYIGNFTMKEGVNVSGGWNAGFTAQTDYATILDANESGRVVNQEAAFSTLTIWSNLTIQNGNVTGTGGGVILFKNGKLSHCKVQNNTCTTQGGGIYCDDSSAGVIIDNCIISGNTANQGGGMRIRGTIQNSTVENNTITDAGGGIHLQGATAINCVVRNNTAKAGAGIRAYGGTVKNCTIEGNSTTTSNTGGVYLQVGAQMFNCIIRNNVSGENTGGVRLTYDSSKPCTLANCLIVGNSAAQTIGGVSLEGGIHYVYNNTIVRNEQTSSSNTSRCGVRLNVNSNLVFANNIVWGNKANNSVQADQMEIHATYASDRAATYFLNNAVVHASVGTNTTVLTATDPGFTDAANGDYTLLETSDLVDAGNNTYAQGLYDLADNARISGDNVDMGCYEYQYPILVDNYVHSDEDLQEAIDATPAGTTVYVQAGTYYGNFTMKDGVNVSGGWNEDFTSQTDYSTILDANNSGRVVTQSAAFSNLTVWSNLTIQNGNVTGTGGGVTLCKNGKLSHCKVKNNTCTTQGGGIYCDDSSAGVIIDDCIISGNTANQGGGLRIRGTIQNSTIENNTITDAGGGIHLQGATAINCIVRNNTAKAGGGIRAYGGTVKNCTIEGNSTTTSNTGGVYLQVGATMQNCKILNNTSGENTGGVRMTYDSEKSCTLANCLIAGNSAAGTIGGISLEGGTHNVYNNTIVNNNQSSASNASRCGVRLNVGAPLVFANNIIWENKANNAVQASQIEIASSYLDSKSAYFINNAIVYSSDFGTNTILLPESPFADADYHLLPFSELINSGNNEKCSGTTDLDGNPRKQGTIDRGCYERTMYSREVTEGKWGTICLPFDVAACDYAGAKVYKVASFATDEKVGLLLDQVEGMEAGKPYFFQAESDAVKFGYVRAGDAAVAGNENGLYGTIEGETVSGEGYYVLQNNLLCPTYNAATGEDVEVTLAKNRAYLKFAEVPDYVAVAPAPSRRVIAIQQAENTATGISDQKSAVSNQKVLRDGQLMIVRDGKTYNVLGM